MKMTSYSRALLRLCRKMHTCNWELKNSAIRKLDLNLNHCPLSYCGNVTNIRDYIVGGCNLGFSESQSIEIATVIDASDWKLKFYSKLRSILIKAARL